MGHECHTHADSGWLGRVRGGMREWRPSPVTLSASSNDNLILFNLLYIKIDHE